MNVGRLVALVALTLAATRAASPQGTPALVIRVLERTTQQPLPNAEVIDLDGGARRFTNAEGEARLGWGPTGRLRLRVRQLGFQFVEQDVTRTAEAVRRLHMDGLVVRSGLAVTSAAHVFSRKPPSSEDVTAAFSGLPAFAAGMQEAVAIVPLRPYRGFSPRVDLGGSGSPL